MSSKYDNDAPFADPVVRCCECSKIILVETLRGSGSCPHCGNRRVRNVLTFNSDELKMMEDWRVDSEFLGLFKGDPDARV